MEGLFQGADGGGEDGAVEGVQGRELGGQGLSGGGGEGGAARGDGGLGSSDRGREIRVLVREEAREQGQILGQAARELGGKMVRVVLSRVSVPGGKVSIGERRVL